MDAKTLRAASTAILLVLVGAAAMSGPGSEGPSAVGETLPLTNAAGAVLAASATPLPAAQSTLLPTAAVASIVPTAAALEPAEVGAREGWTPIALPARPTTPRATPAPAPISTIRPVAVKHPAPATPAVTYKGVNHVWIPSLGINKAVAWFPCDRVEPPADAMYRWGCGGSNNVYLMGHAYGPMKPLHDAYVRGTLKVGMRAYYADAAGQVHIYAVTWWKLTLPTTDAAWAWAPQPVASMTLQTCVGASSQYRLMVRLVEVSK